MSVATAVHPLLTDPDYLPLKRHLIESTGLAYYRDKDADLVSRISTRIAELGLSSCGAYLELLKNRDAGEAERHVLIGQLTIGETYFFRHTEQFDALRDLVLPDLIERNQQTRSLRIWSAGCAIGAEPYTIAILLKQHFADRLAGWDVRILGTDINQTFLARASRGEFDERALRSTRDEVKRLWFTESARTWTVRPFLKEWVTFQYHNLVEHPYPSIVHGIAALDLILCRNVMIYFDWAVIAGILDRFHECLIDGGWLAVGHAESNTEAFRAYRTVNVPGATLYQKNGSTTYTPNLIDRYSPDPPTFTQGYGGQEGGSLVPWVPPALPAIPEFAPVAVATTQVAHLRSTPDLKVGPTSEVAIVRRLADEGRWVDAAAECERLLERDQLNAALHFYQALIHEQTRRDQDAEQSFRRAIYLDRNFALAHYHLALLLDKSGRRDSATQSLRNVQGLLARMNSSDPIADADGLTVEDLRRLTSMHLDLWRK